MKVIYTDKYINQCSCGRVVIMQCFARVEEGSTIGKRSDGNIYLGTCLCGRFFVPKEDKSPLEGPMVTWDWNKTKRFIDRFGYKGAVKPLAGKMFKESYIREMLDNYKEEHDHSLSGSCIIK